MAKFDNEAAMVFVITSSSKGLAIQKSLFILPYAVIAITGALLLFKEKEFVTRRVLGGLNLSLLVVYFLGLMGNHYVKIYSMLANLVGLFALLIVRDILGAWLLLVIFWIPCILCLRIVTRVPSISEILPKLYLGNRKAPHHPFILQQYSITNILELTDNGKTKNDPAKVKNATVLQLVATDTLGSHESLSPEILEQGATFIDKGATDGTLVHCTAGVSRSAAMVLYYLVTRQNLTIKQANAKLRRQRPVVDISVDHIAAVQKALQEQKKDKRMNPSQ